MSKSNRVFLCTCKIEHKRSNKQKGVDKRHLKFHETEVNDEEICIHCGHYAWEKPMHVRFPRGSQGNGDPYKTEVTKKQYDWVGRSDEYFHYFNKTVFSDWETDNGLAFEEREGTKDLRKKSIDDDLRDMYVRWGGNNGEG